MPPIRTSITLSTGALAALDARDGAEEATRSGTIDEIVQRYAAMVEALTPEFALQEWALICDALNGVWMRDLGRWRSSGWLYAELADACDPEIGALATKHEVRPGPFIERVRALTYPQALAVADVATRFWARSKIEEPMAEALKAAGARILNPST